MRWLICLILMLITCPLVLSQQDVCKDLAKENKDLKLTIELMREEMIMLKMGDRLQKELQKLNYNAVMAVKPTKRKSVNFLTGVNLDLNPDFGLMYQYDFGLDYHLRSSVGVTMRGYTYLGIGFNF